MNLSAAPMQTSGNPTNDPPKGPKPHKPRLPKAYTDAQLVYLRGHLQEFERRSQGAVRGDAKKFALERADEFVVQFGLPDDLRGLEEAEPRFREQIYNWYKNTVGRTRRKLEGKPRSLKKAAQKAQQQGVAWTADLNSPTIIPYDHASTSTAPQSVSYGNNNGRPQSNGSSAPSMSTNHLSLNLNVATLRDAFLTPAIDTNTLSGMIQTFALSHPSHTPLTTVVAALFDAICVAQAHPAAAPPDEPSASLLRRFADACAVFPASLSHAGAAGAHAGPRALQMAVRKAAVWVPSPLPLAQDPAQSSLVSDMERIAADRQRRKDYIQWARVHGAALELGLLDAGTGRALAEMMARDAVWEQDEVEWVAGIFVLRSVVRTAMRGDMRQREEYERLLRTYEGRWKEIKDETRQALVTEVLLGTKEDLRQLDDSMAMT
ncbi:hypothetical protein PLICRDRAFT_176642 [Plicaturopsis crispa FD-325 SS-3]|nr:hypothetical protein PLICRDRAFT_176642 [Plicaturopsis crispa FD-325 SS-3]